MEQIYGAMNTFIISMEHTHVLQVKEFRVPRQNNFLHVLAAFEEK